MKKKIIIITLFVSIYLIVDYFFNIYIPCPIHFITGFYCPGCGVTRMIKSILKLDLYQAFRYNPLLFVLLPFFILLFADFLYSKKKSKKSIYEKIPNIIWIILIIILIIYGIIRNFIPSLAPTKI